MKTMDSRTGIALFPILIVVLLMAISLAGGAYLWDLSKNVNESSESTEDLSETPNRQIGEIKPEKSLAPILPAPVSAKPIAPGKQTYLVSGKFLGPLISKVTIDPQDAKAGQMQKITVEVSDTNPVTRVSVTVKLDNKSNTFNLKLVSGTTTQGVWEAEAPFPDDTLFTNYTVTEIAESATGKSSTTTTIR